MPRSARTVLDETLYYVFNAGAGDLEPFSGYGDCRDFALSVDTVSADFPMDVHGWALPPGELHMLVRPATAETLGQWMRKLLTSHAVRFRKQYGGSGAVWSGRYKAVAVQDGPARDMVMRVMATTLMNGGENAVRSRLWLSPKYELQVPQTPATDAERQIVSHCLRRGIPIGDVDWMIATADAIGLRPVLKAGRKKKGAN